MRFQAAVASILAAASAACAQMPTIYVAADFCAAGNQDAYFSINTRQFNTPVVRMTPYLCATQWSPVGKTWWMAFAESDSSTNLVHIGPGTVYSNYVDFTPSATSFARAVENWYCVFTCSTATSIVSYAEGSITIERAPETFVGNMTLGAPFGTGPVNWDLLGPYYGVWPLYSSNTGTLQIVSTSTGLNLVLSFPTDLAGIASNITALSTAKLDKVEAASTYVTTQSVAAGYLGLPAWTTAYAQIQSDISAGGTASYTKAQSDARFATTGGLALLSLQYGATSSKVETVFGWGDHETSGYLTSVGATNLSEDLQNQMFMTSTSFFRTIWAFDKTTNTIPLRSGSANWFPFWSPTGIMVNSSAFSFMTNYLTGYNDGLGDDHGDEMYILNQSGGYTFLWLDDQNRWLTQGGNLASDVISSSNIILIVKHTGGESYIPIPAEYLSQYPHAVVSKKAPFREYDQAWLGYLQKAFALGDILRGNGYWNTSELRMRNGIIIADSSTNTVVSITATGGVRVGSSSGHIELSGDFVQDSTNFFDMGKGTAHSLLVSNVVYVPLATNLSSPPRLSQVLDAIQSNAVVDAGSSNSLNTRLLAAESAITNLQALLLLAWSTASNAYAGLPSLAALSNLASAAMTTGTAAYAYADTAHTTGVSAYAYAVTLSGQLAAASTILYTSTARVETVAGMVALASNALNSGLTGVIARAVTLSNYVDVVATNAYATSLQGYQHDSFVKYLDWQAWQTNVARFVSFPASNSAAGGVGYFSHQLTAGTNYWSFWARDVLGVGTNGWDITDFP